MAKARLADLRVPRGPGSTCFCVATVALGCRGVRGGEGAQAPAWRGTPRRQRLANTEATTLQQGGPGSKDLHSLHWQLAVG